MAANPAVSPAPDLIKVREAARMLGVSTWTVYNLMDDGAIPRISIRRAVRTSRAAVLAYIERQTAQAAETAAAASA